jgi:hypothetical protein
MNNGMPAFACLRPDRRFRKRAIAVDRAVPHVMQPRQSDCVFSAALRQGPFAPKAFPSMTNKKMKNNNGSGKLKGSFG